MCMRTAAAILLLTLIGPTIARAICDLTCVHHERGAAQVTSQRCHEQRPANDEPAMTDGAARFCHDLPQVFSTTAAHPPPLNAAPAAAQLPSVLVAYRPQLSAVTRRPAFGPPDFVLQTTPLRI